MMRSFAIYFIILVIALPSASGEDEINPENFHNLVVSLKNNRAFTSIDYIYEGNCKIFSNKNKDDFKSFDYNGHYTYRKDRNKNNQATFLDMYEGINDPNEGIKHTTKVLLNGECSTLEYKKNRPPRASDIKKSKQKTFGNFTYVSSPELFLPVQFLLNIDENHSGMTSTFKFKGNKNVENSECLVFEMDPNATTSRAGHLKYVYYLDPTKGMNIIKYQKYDDNKLCESVEEVVLKFINYRDNKNNEGFWYPVNGTYKSFVSGVNGYDSTPTVISKFRILPDTILIDQNISEDNFSIFRTNVAQSKQLSKLKNEVEYYKKIKTKTANKQQILEQQLIELNKQSQELHASHNNAGNWEFVIWIRAIGIIGLVAALIYFIRFAIKPKPSH